MPELGLVLLHIHWCYLLRRANVCMFILFSTWFLLHIHWSYLLHAYHYMSYSYLHGHSKGKHFYVYPLLCMVPTLYSLILLVHDITCFIPLITCHSPVFMVIHRANTLYAYPLLYMVPTLYSLILHVHDITCLIPLIACHTHVRMVIHRENTCMFILFSAWFLLHIHWPYLLQTLHCMSYSYFHGHWQGELKHVKVSTFRPVSICFCNVPKYNCS